MPIPLSARKYTLGVLLPFMLMVEETSKLAYNELKNEGLLGDRQSKVYQYIRNNPHRTANEIAKGMNFSDGNSVKPRITELKDMGLIETTGKMVCDISNRLCYIWVVTNAKN